MLSKDEIQILLSKINRNKASKDEIDQFNAWYSHFDDSKTHVYKLGDQNDIKRSIWNKISNQTKIKPLYQHTHIRIAAALVLLSTFSIIIIQYKKNIEQSPILANVITLEGNSEDNITIHSSESEFLDSTNFLNLAEVKDKNIIKKINTGKAQFIKVQLPDGTKVSLNAGSQLSLNDNFETGTNREVYLNGEAYFEVTKIKDRPFLVISKNQKIHVLGTKFNVKAYDHQKEIITSLLEGSIKLENEKESKILTPNDIAINTFESIEIRKESSQPKIGWRSLNFEFENESVEDVLSQLSNWYNIKVIFKNTIPNFRITGKIPRGTSIDDLQTILQNLTQGKFELKNEELHITFNNQPF